MYGLPKVHKPGCPTRPIVSSIGAYNYKLAKFLVQILQPLSKNCHSIKDSFTFAEWVQGHRITGNSILCSFDVSSLFTNVPLNETIDICLNKITQNGTCKIPPGKLKKLLQFATQKSHFLFNGILYDFADGMAMGSPLAPIMADIFMIDFEEKHIHSKTLAHAPNIWQRYVDDTFCSFDSKDKALHFLTYLNNCHPNIKFTVEFEEEGCLPFLDILIRKGTDFCSTTIHRKKTFTGLYTKWDSFTPRKYKINLIRTLTFRYLKICSSKEILQASLGELKGFLASNGYPPGVLNIPLMCFAETKVQES